MNSGSGEVSIPNNEIWYTSSDGKVVTPYSTSVFGANIVSNTYENGKGVIKFDGPVTSIGKYAFRQRSSLTEITIPNSVTSTGSSAFYYCSSLTNVSIPNSVTSIGNATFRYCSSLTEITIPDGVTRIEDDVFEGCSSLTEITIPDGVTRIGNYAFNGCSGLTSITIPEGVTEIGGRAFIDCSRLQSVYCSRIRPPLGNYSMFDNNASNRKIYVPMKSVGLYQSEVYWIDYASDIVGYNFN